MKRFAKLKDMEGDKERDGKKKVLNPHNCQFCSEDLEWNEEPYDGEGTYVCECCEKEMNCNEGSYNCMCVPCGYDICKECHGEEEQKEEEEENDDKVEDLKEVDVKCPHCKDTLGLVYEPYREYSAYACCTICKDTIYGECYHCSCKEFDDFEHQFDLCEDCALAGRQENY